MRYKAVIFDMDGTVLNTLDDLCDALNVAMGQAGHRADFTPDEVRYFAGGGVGTTVGRALAREKGAALEDLELIGTPDGPAEDPLAPEIIAVFRPYYAAHCNVKTGPYDGIPELITRLRAAGLRTAVVSNKPDASVKELADAQFTGLFDIAIGEQSGIPRKPAPDMVNLALAALGVTDRADAVYVGDSEVDMQTALNSGLNCVCVEWGFRGREFLRKHGADVIAATPEEVGDILLGT